MKFYDLVLIQEVSTEAVRANEETGIQHPGCFFLHLRFLEPLGSNFKVQLKIVFLRPTSAWIFSTIFLKLAKQIGGKKTNKLIFGGLEQVTSLSHAEGQRGWMEVYASTGIKVKIYFSYTWAKNYDSYFKKKEKQKNRTVSYCFTTPFPQCLTSST